MVAPAPDLDQVEACVAGYPAIGRVQELAALPTGRFHNSLFDVRTDLGRFVLKILTTHTEESTEPRYDYIASVIENVSTLGVKGPLPIENDSGLRLTPCGAFSAILSEYIEGQDFERDSLRHQHAAGSLLARIHSASSDFTPRGSCWADGLEGFFVCDGALLNSLPATPEGVAVRDRYQLIVHWCRQVHHELQAAGHTRLPRAVVHSEYVVKHLRMSGDRVVGLLDFEYTYQDARAVDVALALEDFPCSSRGARDFNDGRMRAFLSAYNAAGAPLLPEEISALPVVLKAWCLDSLSYWIHRLARTHERLTLFDIEERISQDLRYLDWWDANGSTFAERVGELAR